MKALKPYKTDVAVFLIFFNRPDTFIKVFESVKNACPKYLFLACDGARNSNETDIILSEECKKIASDIDWDCKVYKDYSTVNLGCGKRMYTGLSWAFKYVDKLIVLEDDCVPNQDFFVFCEEMLNKYENNSHICMIDGMNHLGVYEDCPYSYFFGQGCCWGWATWKRVWDNMDYSMSFLDDKYAMKCVERKYPYYKNAMQVGLQKKNILDNGGKLSAWTYQMGISSALNGEGIAIVPKVNLVTNIGFIGGHAKGLKKMARKTQKYFNIETYELQFPLKHPIYDIEDQNYYDLVKKKFKLNFFDQIERVIRKIIY